MKRTKTMMRTDAGMKSSMKVNKGVRKVLTWREERERREF